MMARIKITKKDEDEAEREPEELAKDMAKDVADEVDLSNPGPRGAESMRPARPDDSDSDEDPNIDPDTNYPKIALLRVSVGADDERSMDEWIEDIRKDLANHKNTTVLTKHFLVDGEPIAAHKVATDE